MSLQNKQKQDVLVRICELGEHLDYTTIDDAILTLQKLKDEHGSNVTMHREDISQPYDDHSSYDYVLYKTRKETDDEYEKRIAQEDKWTKEKLERDLAAYKALKAQFENE